MAVKASYEHRTQSCAGLVINRKVAKRCVCVVVVVVAGGEKRGWGGGVLAGGWDGGGGWVARSTRYSALAFFVISLLSLAFAS